MIPRWSLTLLLVGASTLPGSAQSFRRPFEAPKALPVSGRIDQLVFRQLEAAGIKPAEACSDAVFLRRVYLDCIGTLPTAEEARGFLADRDPDKRRLLVDRLLRRDEFADYWAMKWCDLLRVKSEFPINLWPNAVQAYHHWIRTSIRENKPYDRFVRELLTSSGSNFRSPPVNFYRAVQRQDPDAFAEAVALTFMGQRAENWPSERRAGMAVFFSQIGFKETSEWKEVIVYFDALAARSGGTIAAALPDGTVVQLTGQRDPREVFADWLICPKNPWFSKNIVNRAWYWLQGRGIIHEPDDIRPDNPPSNPELLAYLADELIASGYDLKHVFRLILISNTYQLSSIPASDHPEAERHFAYYPLRRLDAEVLIDALCQITGTTEEYSSPIPEPFTFIPEDQRSISLSDGSITSSFLEMFGRPPRDTGLESERNSCPSADQCLHLLNSSHIQEKIEQGLRTRAFGRSWRKPVELVNDMYLEILSRYPTQEELQAIQQYTQNDGVGQGEVLVDLAWALINSAEFLYRH